MIRAAFSGSVGPFAIDAAFEAPGRGITAIFGPSGCGKTTILRAIAGLARFKTGHLEVNGETWQQRRRFTPTHRREIGYVFQEASLFPHLSIRDNLNFGARRSRQPERISFDEVTDLLGIAALFDRPAMALSGGERQRVAIGRALLSQPRLLLMDEPLSALDRFSKDDILPYLERLHAALKIPVLYVSHDIDEVERLADWLLMMEKGRVVSSNPVPQRERGTADRPQAHARQVPLQHANDLRFAESASLHRLSPRSENRLTSNRRLFRRGGHAP